MMEYLFPILVVLLLITLNGLFVAAEFAIIGAPRTAIERRAARGDQVASLVLGIMRNPRNQDRYIATAQLGITFASLGLGMYGEHQLAHWIAGAFDSWGSAQWILSHTLATILAVLILTYFHIVLGEMIPKSLALQHAEGTAIWVSPPMMAIKYLLYPLVIGLNGIGTTLLHLVGIERQQGSSEQYYSPEELQLVVSESLEGGLLSRDSGQVLKELFSFPDLTAGDVMVPRVRIRGVALGASASELRDAMKESHHARYPVYNGDLDHIIGMIHAKDILRLARDDTQVSESVLRPLPYLPETTKVDRLLSALKEGHSQMVVVMDEHGGTAGLVTVEDLFEELVGEVDEETAAIEQSQVLGDGRLSVDGALRLEELGERLGVELEHEEVESVSGLILARLDRPPKVGDVVSYGGMRFEVTEVEGHGVKQCLVAKE